MHRIFLPLLVMIVLFSGAGYYFFNNQKQSDPMSLTQGRVCEKDSLVCQDGTVLKRQGPKCDFPPCPSANLDSNQEISVRGTTICLPQKEHNRPQTLECALGIHSENGEKYALSDPAWKFLIGIGNGSRVEIRGRVTRFQDSKYENSGIIEIDNLIKL